VTKLTSIIDLDYVKYASASVGEKRSIVVIHRSSGREKEFNTRTEFYGRDKAKTGGWLGEVNAKRDSPFAVDEFEIIDKQIAEPIDHVLQIAKTQVEGDLKRLGTNKYKAFLGKGDSFRVELSTLKKYKDNRKEMLRPLHMDAVTEYLERKFKAEIVTTLEVDDACVIECQSNKNAVIQGLDKDYYGQPVRFFNVNRPDEGIQDCNQFGKLWLDDKGDVRGIGRMHLYWQIASNDTSDNYAANCFSDIKWAGKSAYKSLVEAQDDVDAWQLLKGIFQYLYPEEKTVLGWRNDPISITWDYVLNEMFMMARMLRFEGENLNAYDVMDKMGIDYGCTEK
jgi:hypothetical protein